MVKIKTKNEYEDYCCWWYCLSSLVCDVGVAGKDNGDVVSVAFAVIVAGYDIGIVIVIVMVFILFVLVLRLSHLFVFDGCVLEDVVVNL